MCLFFLVMLWDPKPCHLTMSGRLHVPDGPQLHGEERRPADDVGEHDDHGHLHRLHPGLGHPCHAAGPGGQRLTDHLSDVLRLHVKVEVHGAADAHLAHCHGENGQHEDHQRGPGHVRSRSPRLYELRPAVVHSRGDLNPREDEDLREAADERYAPGCAHRSVPARPATLERHHGVADGLISVYGHHHYHVCWSKHPDHLEVLHCTTQSIRTHESVRDVPHELRTNLEECDHQIGDAQVENEDAHPGELLPPLQQHQQNPDVQDRCQDEDDGEKSYFQLSQALIPRLILGQSALRSDVTRVCSEPSHAFTPKNHKEKLNTVTQQLQVNPAYVQTSWGWEKKGCGRISKWATSVESVHWGATGVEGEGALYLLMCAGGGAASLLHTHKVFSRCRAHGSVMSLLCCTCTETNESSHQSFQ